MSRSIKSIALVCTGLIAGVALTLQLSATAQQGNSNLPLDELRNLSNVFGQIKRDYVEPVEDKRLLTDAIKGMVSGLDPHSSYLDKKDGAKERKIKKINIIHLNTQYFLQHQFCK